MLLILGNELAEHIEVIVLILIHQWLESGKRLDDFQRVLIANLVMNGPWQVPAAQRRVGGGHRMESVDLLCFHILFFHSFLLYPAWVRKRKVKRIPGW